MEHALFTLKTSYAKKEALKELLSFGLENPYFIEDKASQSYKIGGFFKQIPKKTTYCNLEPVSNDIDWDLQWKLHSPYYKDGLLHIDLNDFGFSLEKKNSILLLKPGSGFGDLSHPTTQMMLKAMGSFLKDHDILDIGCGCGVLSLSAYKLLKTNVLGVDIDKEALLHSQQNTDLNCLSSLRFSNQLNLNGLNKNNLAVLINMIWPEQLQVFSSYPCLDFKGLFIISGLLNSQITSYLQSFPYKGFFLINSLSHGDWTCLILSNNL